MAYCWDARRGARSAVVRAERSVDQKAPRSALAKAGNWAAYSAVPMVAEKADQRAEMKAWLKADHSADY